MAERDRASLLREIAELRENEKSLIRDINSGASGLNERLREQRKLIAEASVELKKINEERIKGFKDQEQQNNSLSDMYKSLTDLEQRRMLLTIASNDISEEGEQALERMAEINRELAQLSISDVVAKQALSEEYKNLTEEISGIQGIDQQILNNLASQNALAQNYSNMTEGQKEQLEAQLEAYNGIKKTINGVLDTARILFSGWRGFARITLIGAGKAITELGKSTREFGGFLGGAQISATGLSLVFDDALDVTKQLSAEMGGLDDVTFANQLNTNLMATNMGISGQEAAKLTGALARLNGNSIDTAQNLAQGAKEMAKTAGVVPSAVMADLAGSAEEFALFGKDGGKNLAQAAVQAAKMGVSLKTMTGVADNLLDFENSINQEMELGAMLGKNINLDRARALAYEGDIAGATQETLAALGGVDEFNKMDYFQKKKTAELLGTSVEELQKMVTQQEEASTIGGKISAGFNTMTESLTALTTGPLGGFVTGLSGAIGTSKEIAGNFKDAGGFLKDMGGKITSMFGGKAPAAPGAAAAPATPTAPPQTQAGPADQANKMSKIKSGDLIKGAAALLILAAALFVAAKAFQEFGEVTWESVGMGLVALAGLAGIAYVLSKASGAMMQGALAVAVLGAALIPFAFAMSLIENLKIDAVLAAAAGLVMFGLAAAGIGMILPLILAGSAGIAALGGAMIVFGTGLMLVSGGMGAISAVIPFVTEQISALSQIDFMPIFGLAAALTTLSVALAAVAVTGMLALPALLALGLIAGGAAALMGGGEEGGDRTGELIDEIKGLRADLNSGKIAVNIDGQKVTSNIGKVVSRLSTNSYAKT
jgi:hypothetical protein